LVDGDVAGQLRPVARQLQSAPGTVRAADLIEQLARAPR
jgi:hypothetical protein